MTVYVDDMHRYAMGEFRGMKMSHMIADTEDELHAMADRIGIARRWYQGDHYDVAMSKRDAAIAAGAVAIPLKVLARMALNRRRGLPLGSPEQVAAEIGVSLAPRDLFDQALDAISKHKRDAFVAAVLERFPGAEVITVREVRR
jgi:hypothetical protein